MQVFSSIICPPDSLGIGKWLTNLKTNIAIILVSGTECMILDLEMYRGCHRFTGLNNALR